MGRKLLVTLAILPCLLLAGAAFAENGFKQTWSAPPSVEEFANLSGDLSNPGTGGNPGGYLRATCFGGYNIAMRPVPFLWGDWGVLFGTNLGTIQFDVKAISDHPIPQIVVCLNQGNQAFRRFITTTAQLGHSQTTADGWVHYSFPWRATWNTATAQANGWVKYNPTSDWPTVLAAPAWSYFTVAGSLGTGDQVVGVDNFRIEAGRELDPEVYAIIEAGGPGNYCPPDPVAEYTFEEGSGATLPDHSGRNNHGTIHGAAWVPLGNRYALEFDGIDDYVDCGNFEDTMYRPGKTTMQVWVYAEPQYDQYVPILGNGWYKYYQNSPDVIVAAPGNVQNYLPARKWVHLAEIWNGETTKLYVDGQLMGVNVAAPAVGPAGTFLMGGPAAPAFKGKIGHIKIHHRALTEEELREQIRTTNITGSVIPSPVPVPGRSKIKVEVDMARLGQAWDTLTANVEVLDLQGVPCLSDSVSAFDDIGRAIVDLDASSLAAGTYVVRATAKDGQGATVGLAGEEQIIWAGNPNFPSGPAGARKLNNLVTELLNVPGPDESGEAFAFVNPRSRWIFISNEGSAEVILSGSHAPEPTPITLSQDFDEAYETVRRLPQGSYTISTARAKDLIVRAIPELIYDVTPWTPHIAEYMPPGGVAPFEDRYVFPHHVGIVNVSPDAPATTTWKNRGRRMYSNLTRGSASTVQEVYDRIVSNYGFAHPNMHGQVIDEFGGGSPLTTIWAQGIDQALSEPQYADKTIHTYTYGPLSLASTPDGVNLLNVQKEHDNAVTWEAYMNTQRSDWQAWHYINHQLVGLPLECEKHYAGFTDNLIVVFYSYVTAGPPWLTHSWPGVDANAWMDMQVQTVATHPDYADVYGVGVYRSAYADPETIRLTARLFRHYGIEGRTDPFIAAPYELSHVQNPDFEEGQTGWTIQPAEEGKIRFGLLHQLGGKEGRYDGPTRNQGDNGIITRRSAVAPNRFSQQITSLVPGRLYSLRMMSAYVTDTWRHELHAVTVAVDGATSVPEKSFTSIAMARLRTDYLNYHYRVFRATGTTATLKVSDWASEAAPGGPLGQDIIYNYVRVQPFWIEHRLTVQSVPVNNVPVTGNSPGTTPYVRHVQDNAAVSLTAPASADGYAFLRWEDDDQTLLTTDQTLELALDADRSVVAVFEITTTTTSTTTTTTTTEPTTTTTTTLPTTTTTSSTTTTTLPIIECIIDNKDDLSEKYFQTLYGSWRTNNGGTARWDPADPASDYRWEYAQTGGETARAEWVCTSLPGGSYEVFAWWLITTSSMGQNVAYEVHHAEGVTTVRKHQGLNGGQWNSLGTYTFDAGSHVVQIHNGEAKPGTYIVADAVKFVSTGGTTTTSSTSSTTTSSTSTTTTTTLPGTECIIDNKDTLGDKYFQTLSGSWRTNNGGTDRWDPADPTSDYRWTYSQTGLETARAEWVCTSLPAGEYEVFAWWLITTSSMGQNVAYEVHHAEGVTTVRKHQGLSGGQWNSLGTYTFDAGSHVVQIHNGEAKPGTYIVADAVKFVSTGGTTSTTTMTSSTTTTSSTSTTTTTTLPGTECIIDNKDSLTERYFQTLSGSWRTNNGGTARWDPADPASDYRWEYAQTGGETARAEWVCTSLAGGSYEVFAWWLITTSSMGQNVAYEVHHAGGVTTVRKHQGLNGGQWNSLGTYTFDAGSHVVQIHNGEAKPGKYIVADAIRFVQVSP